MCFEVIFSFWQIHLKWDFPPPLFLSVFKYSLSLFSGSAFCLLLVPSGPQFWNRAYTKGLGAGAEPGWGLDKFTVAPWALFCPTSFSAGEPLLVITFLNLCFWAGEPHCYPCFTLQAWILSPATYRALSVLLPLQLSFCLSLFCPCLKLSRLIMLVLTQLHVSSLFLIHKDGNFILFFLSWSYIL